MDDRITRLIVGKLDGELTPAEEHEVNQVLLHSAEARRMLSDFQEIDRLVLQVLGPVVEGRRPAVGPPREVRSGRRLVLWGGTIGTLAAAATIAIVVGLLWNVIQPGKSGPTQKSAPVGISGRSYNQPDYQLFTGTDLPNRGERKVDRDCIGVFDEAQGTLYIMELNRTRTVRIPVAGDL
jgi:hypothetical protein